MQDQNENPNAVNQQDGAPPPSLPSQNPIGAHNVGSSVGESRYKLCPEVDPLLEQAMMARPLKDLRRILTAALRLQLKFEGGYEVSYFEIV